jgi:hypothetical protein
MNLKELRGVMDNALREEGLEELRLFPKGPKVWTLPADDIVRFFWPQAIRRPGGFTYDGAIGVEIPSLRAWLREFKRDDAGIFHSCFVCYLIINEEVRREFMVQHGNPIPADLWAGLLKDKLELVPPTLDAFIGAYRRNKEELGWLAHPNQRHAWDFLLKWRENPDPSMQVPKMLPNGRIV